MALLLKGMQYFCPWYWQQGGEREKDVKDDIYCSVQIALGKVWPQIGTLLTNTKMYLRDNWGKTKLILLANLILSKKFWLHGHKQSANFDLSSSFWKASAWKRSCTIFLQIYFTSCRLTSNKRIEHCTKDLLQHSVLLEWIVL